MQKSTNAIVQVEGLKKAYKEKNVLNNISFDLYQNEIVAIVGPNGAGKTTLLEILMTLRKYDQGDIIILGHKLTINNNKKIKSLIGVIFQEGGMYAYLKIREILDLFAGFYHVDKKRVNEMVELFNLSSHLNSKFQSLSGGWKQRVLLATAFLHRPKLLFLDEPTTGLDPEATEQLWHAIQSAKEEGATIILSTHNLEEIDLYADRVMILNNGSIQAYDRPHCLKEIHEAVYFKEAYFNIIKGLMPA